MSYESENNIQFCNATAIAALQNREFKKMITYLSDYSPFYKRLFIDHSVNIATIKTIEDLDARLVGRILAGLEKTEAVVAVLPDHPTPVEQRIHVRDAVPFVIRDPRRQADGVQCYDEVSCAAGGFGTVHGDEFIRAVFR